MEVWRGPKVYEFGTTEGEDWGGFLKVGEEEADGGSVLLRTDAYDLEEATGGLRDDGDGDRFEEDVDGLEENVCGNGFELLELGGLDGDWSGVEENVGWFTCCGLSVTGLLFPEDSFEDFKNPETSSKIWRRNPILCVLSRSVPSLVAENVKHELSIQNENLTKLTTSYCFINMSTVQLCSHMLIWLEYNKNVVITVSYVNSSEKCCIYFVLLSSKL